MKKPPDPKGARTVSLPDLSVQQLALIYEHPLKHDVIEQDGAAAVNDDETVRKDSGSF